MAENCESDGSAAECIVRFCATRSYQDGDALKKALQDDFKLSSVRADKFIRELADVAEIAEKRGADASTEAEPLVSSTLSEFAKTKYSESGDGVSGEKVLATNPEPSPRQPHNLPGSLAIPSSQSDLTLTKWWLVGAVSLVGIGAIGAIIVLFGTQYLKWISIGTIGISVVVFILVLWRRYLRRYWHVTLFTAMCGGAMYSGGVSGTAAVAKGTDPQGGESVSAGLEIGVNTNGLLAFGIVVVSGIVAVIIEVVYVKKTNAVT
ncbi:MAG: hypothetical protein AAF593_00765 [Planctomycetota bacterium]